MTRRAWIILGVVAAMFVMLLMTGVGVGGYLLYQHKKQTHEQELANTIVDTVDHSKDRGDWELDSSYDSSTESVLRWYSIKSIQKQYDITIFNTGSISITRLDMNAPAFTCPMAGDSTCDVTVLFDDKPTELWTVRLRNDGAGGVASIVDNEAFLKPLAQSEAVVIVFGTISGNKNVAFKTHGCPVVTNTQAMQL